MGTNEFDKHIDVRTKGLIAGNKKADSELPAWLDDCYLVVLDERESFTRDFVSSFG